MPTRFNPGPRQPQLAVLPHWHHDADRDAIARQFVFADFAQAFGFMAQLALAAERLGHHPEWPDHADRLLGRIAGSTRDLPKRRVSARARP